MCSGESKVKWLMTEFVFSMNYFFWLLAFKDGSFSDGLKQGLLGAGPRSPAFPLLLKAGRGCPVKEAAFPNYDHSHDALFLLPFKTSPATAPWRGRARRVQRALDLESKRPEFQLQLCHVLISWCRECHMTSLVSGLQSEKCSDCKCCSGL